MLMGNIGALAITVADGPIWVTPRDLSLLLGTVSLAANSQCHFLLFMIAVYYLVENACSFSS